MSGNFLSCSKGVKDPLEFPEARCDLPVSVGALPGQRLKWGSSGCGRDSRASSQVETGMSGNFFSCNKGVKDPLEVPEIRCD